MKITKSKLNFVYVKNRLHHLKNEMATDLTKQVMVSEKHHTLEPNSEVTASWMPPMNGGNLFHGWRQQGPGLLTLLLLAECLSAVVLPKTTIMEQM